MGPITKNIVIIRIIIGGLIGLTLISGGWYFLHRYFDVVSDIRLVVNNNPISPQTTVVTAVDTAKLNEEYLAQSSKIITGYLAVASSTNADLPTISKTAQTDLLNLTLPKQYRAKHLAEVLLLGEIADLALSGNPKTATKKIADLKEIFEKK